MKGIDRDGYTADEAKKERDKDSDEDSQSSSESEDETTDVTLSKHVVDTKKRSSSKKKTQKHTRSMNEGYTQMPRNTGFCFPVYADCQEALQLKAMTKTEEMAMLMNVALVQFLPKPNTDDKGLKEQLEHIGVDAKVLKAIGDAKKKSEAERKLNMQKSNLLYQLSNSLRVMIGAERTSTVVKEEQLLDFERLAAITDKVAQNELQKTAGDAVDEFCKALNLHRNPDIDRLVTDPDMLNSANRQDVLNTLAEALELSITLNPLNCQPPPKHHPVGVAETTNRRSLSAPGGDGVAHEQTATVGQIHAKSSRFSTAKTEAAKVATGGARVRGKGKGEEKDRVTGTRSSTETTPGNDDRSRTNGDVGRNGHVFGRSKPRRLFILTENQYHDQRYACLVQWLLLSIQFTVQERKRGGEEDVDVGVVCGELVDLFRGWVQREMDQNAKGEPSVQYEAPGSTRVRKFAKLGRGQNAYHTKGEAPVEGSQPACGVPRQSDVHGKESSTCHRGDDLHDPSTIYNEAETESDNECGGTGDNFSSENATNDESNGEKESWRSTLQPGKQMVLAGDTATPFKSCDVAESRRNRFPAQKSKTTASIQPNRGATRGPRKAGQRSRSADGGRSLRGSAANSRGRGELPTVRSEWSVGNRPTEVKVFSGVYEPAFPPGGEQVQFEQLQEEQMRYGIRFGARRKRKAKKGEEDKNKSPPQRRSTEGGSNFADNSANTLLEAVPKRGNGQEQSTCRSEVVRGEQAHSTNGNEARRSERSESDNISGVQILEVGLAEGVLPDLGAATTALNAKDLGPAETQRHMDVGTTPEYGPVPRPGYFSRDHHETVRGRPASTPEPGAQMPHQSGRFDSGATSKSVGSYDADIRDNDSPDQVRRGPLGGQRRPDTTPQGTVARNGILLGGRGVLTTSSQSHQSGTIGKYVPGSPQRQRSADGESPTPSAGALGVHNGSGPTRPGDVYRTPRIESRNDSASRPLELEGARRPAGSGIYLAPDSGTQRDGSMRSLDEALQLGQPGADGLERVPVLQRGTDSGDKHGRVQLSSGGVRDSGQGERVRQIRNVIPFRWAGNCRTHNAARDSSSGRWNTGSVEATRIQRLQDSGANRCNGGSEVHRMPGRQDSVVLKASVGTGMVLQTNAHLPVVGPHQGDQERVRLVKQNAVGDFGISNGAEAVCGSANDVGAIRPGCVRGEMEPPVAAIFVETNERFKSGGARHSSVSAAERRPNNLDLSSATSTPYAVDITAADLGRSRGSDDHTLLAGHSDGGSPENGSGDASGDRNQQGTSTAATCVLATRKSTGKGEALVNPKAMEGITWSTFVRQAQESRGFSESISEQPEVIYKRRSGSMRGQHHVGPFALFVAGLNQKFGRGDVDVTDIVICDIVAQQAVGEGALRRILSSIRTVCQLAFGDIDQLKYETVGTKVLVAKAKAIEITTPKYSTPVDLGCSGSFASVWMIIVQDNERVEQLSNTNRAKMLVKRNTAIFLNRHDSVSRSDDETKCDLRNSEECRCYSPSGVLQEQVLMSQRLDNVAEGQGGWVERNYRNPKDPLKKGIFSMTVTTRPLRLSVLTDPTSTQPYLRTRQRVSYLCAVRALAAYQRCLEAGNGKKVLMVKLGHTWGYLKPKTLDNVLQPLLASSIANIVKGIAERGKLKMGGGGEQPGATEQPVVGDGDGHERPGRANVNGRGKLAGHFLRGHAGSIIYTLALECGASWDAMDCVSRARHTIASFLKSYCRNVTRRLKEAFKGHPKKAQMRFEEASRL